MNRDQWLKTFAKNSDPGWPCPWCGKGMLRPVNNSFTSRERAESRKQQNDHHYDEELEKRTFTCWFKCDGVCKEDVAITGTSGKTFVYDEGPDEELIELIIEYCQPLIAEPMPPIFEIPKGAPDNVSADLQAAFRLVWIDPGAAANRVRVAVEHLLDYLGIPATVETEKGTLLRKLHERIELYAKKEPTYGAHLMAIKWLGNTASHEGQVSREAFIDACEILEHTLSEILEQRSKTIAKLAEKLTKEHRPRSR
jgi:hypothetical protein